MITAAVRVGVVGVGHLGAHHARIYADLARASGGTLVFAGVYDADTGRAREAVAKHGGRAYPDLAAFVADVDAASVATPTESHFEVARSFLDQGRHVLIEKPITAEVAQAAELVRLARERQCRLQVGHVERFNPVLGYLQEVLETPRFIEVHRLSPYPGRSTDIGVVLDLMIHDLDIILALVRAPLAAVEAVGIPVLSRSEDIANARLRFANGCVANVTASRVSPERLRKLRIFGTTRQGAAYISLDYLRQAGQIYRLAGDDQRASSLLKKLLAGNEATIVTEFAGRKIVREPVPIARGEPLQLELQDFLESVRTRRQPRVSGEAAQQALEVAIEITRQVRAGISAQ